jgi:DNA-binding CsgD family transcriptional regulator
MARKDAAVVSASDVEALLSIGVNGAAPPRLRVLERLCELLPAHGVDVGEDRDSPPSAAQAPSAAPAVVNRSSAHPALDDGGACLSCVVSGAGGRATRVKFRRGRSDPPFGRREMTIVQVMARVGWLNPDEPGQAHVLANLPRRQEQVLYHLRNGAGEKQIARSLNLSINTIKEHVQRLYHRFEVNSRGELMARLFCGDEAGSPGDEALRRSGEASRRANAAVERVNIAAAAARHAGPHRRMP